MKYTQVEAVQKSNYIHLEQAKESATDKLSKSPDITGETFNWCGHLFIYSGLYTS